MKKKELNIFNGCNHPIRIFKGCVRDNYAGQKYIGGDLIKEIPMNYLLNAQINIRYAYDVDGIPIYTRDVLGCTPLPERDDLGKAYDMYIVSIIYAQAYNIKYPNHYLLDKLYIIQNTVMENGRPSGCMGLTPYIQTC